MSGVEHEYRRYMVSGQTIKIRTSSMLVPNTDTMRERYRLRNAFLPVVYIYILPAGIHSYR